MNRKAFVATLAGCAALPALLRAPRGEDGDPAIITLSGSGPEGRWFAETSLFGKVLTREIPGLTVNGVIGKGVSIGNIRRIAAGDVEGGRFYPFDLENAHANRAPFATGAYGGVVVWMKLGMNLFRVVADAGIGRFSDLAGKTVAVGVRGSGDDFLAQRILGGYGIDESNTRFHFVGRGDGQAALAAGEIDAIAFSYTRNNQGHLGPIFASRRLGEDVDFVEPDADRNAAFLAAEPAFFLDTRGEPVFGRPELSGIAYNQGMAIHRGLSDDLVYRMTRVLYEQWDEVLSGAPWWNEPGEATLEEAAALTTLPYHPGARRYYEEMGVWRRHQAG
ncbi:MAG TPA: TAXI family TRAP transporter solute-binding subunit [Longimicrobiales bacterium]|nr:TAXI family TRAP transporter solute-binding subunit [Longimicrobiales bacterium]